jgi:DNA-binding GntR family transcriptional regulator
VIGLQGVSTEWNTTLKLSDVAYKRFKESLFSHRLALGAMVSQAELVELLDVPLTPLRDAVHRLHAEGLVEIMPRSGIRILKPDMELIRHTYQLRTMLEREGIRRYAEVCTAAEVASWAEPHEAVEQALDAGMGHAEAAALAQEVDDAFHHAVIGSLRNPIIDEVYRQTRDRVALIRLDRAYVLSPPLIRATMREHRAVLDALGANDRDAAARAMDEHLTHSLHRAMGF